MKDSWEKIEKKNKRRGAIISAMVHAIVVLLLLIFGLSSAFPPPQEGILINFGTMETGKGDQPSVISEDPEKLSPQEAEATPVEVTEKHRELVTQNVEEAPSIRKEEKAEEKKPVVKKEETKKDVKEQKKPVKEEPRVDTKSLYTGEKSDEDNPNNEGLTYGPGDQGDPEGDPSSKNYEGDSKGLGNVGVGYDLAGRKLLFISPIDENYTETGKVVVNIKVDRSGKVLFAKYTVKGSTTTDPMLIKLAEEAARDAKFSPNSDVAEEQFGTITFTFKLK
ncbi:MAG TPA: TonB family protein [Chitinophagales bacterium]|nr:TonB family protein [Chitinophagales bacterium]